MKLTFKEICSAIESTVFKSTGDVDSGDVSAKVTFEYADGRTYYVKYMHRSCHSTWEISSRVYGKTGWDIGPTPISVMTVVPEGVIEFEAVMDLWTDYTLDVTPGALKEEVSKALE